MKKTISIFIGFLLLFLLFLTGLISMNQDMKTLKAVNGEIEIKKEALNEPVIIAGEWKQTGQNRVSCTLIMDDVDELSVFGINMRSSNFFVNGEMAQEATSIYDLSKNKNEQNRYQLEIQYNSNENPQNIPYGIELGKSNDILRSIQYEVSLRMMSVGLTFGCFLFSLILFLQKKSEKYLLFLCLLSLSTFGRTFYNAYPTLSSHVYFRLLGIDFFSFLPISSKVNEFLQLYTLKLIVFLLHYMLFKQFTSIKVGKISILYPFLILFVFMLVSIPFGSVFYWLLLFYYFCLALVEGYILARSVHQEPFFCACMGIAWCLTNSLRLFDILCRFQIIPHGSIDMQFRLEGLIECFYSIGFQIAVNYRFSLKFKEADQLRSILVETNANLQKTVEAKTAELRLSYQKLQIMQKNKESMLSNIIHDLKTPLFSLGGYTDMALDSLHDNPEMTKKSLVAINRNADTIGKMLNTLFLSMRLEDGIVKFQEIPLHLEEVLKNNVENSKLKANHKNQSLRFVRSCSEDEYIGDFYYLQQAFQNILDNAIEHSDKAGEITIELEKQESLYFITISDQGEGIEEEDLDNIFNRYYSKYKNQRASSGLGLSISLEIVEHYHGKIDVQSKVGIGSKFTITLPENK